MIVSTSTPSWEHWREIRPHRSASSGLTCFFVVVFFCCNYTLITAIEPEECPTSGSADVLRRVPVLTPQESLRIRAGYKCRLRPGQGSNSMPPGYRADNHTTIPATPLRIEKKDACLPDISRGIFASRFISDSIISEKWKKKCFPSSWSLSNSLELEEITGSRPDSPFGESSMLILFILIMTLIINLIVIKIYS